MRILAENTSCIVIDYQEKILPAMSGREELVANSAALLKGLNLLEIHGIDHTVCQGIRK